MDDRWHNLPDDILHKNVLPKLDVPSLCRFRAVCKDWNTRICEPDFHKKETPYLLMSAEVTIARWFENWEIEDVITGRHFVISQNFLQKLPFVQLKCSSRWLQYFRITMAADKGFLLVGWKAADHGIQAMCVTNPVTKSFQEIPLFPMKHDFIEFVIAMVVDEDRLRFKIYAIYNIYDSFVFDSQVGKWIYFSSAFVPPSIESFTPCHTLRRGRNLYVVFVKDWDKPATYEIWTLNTETCEWMFQFQLQRLSPFWTTADDPRHLYKWSSPQLVACGNRLFFTWLDSTEDGTKRIGIWKIRRAHNYSCEQVAVSSDHADGHRFWCPIEEDSTYYLLWESALTMIREYCGYWGRLNLSGTFAVLAFGTDDNRIIFTSITGSSLVFSLSDQSWVHTPSCWKSFQDTALFIKKGIGLVGNMMPLTLSPVPQVAQPPAQAQQPT